MPSKPSLGTPLNVSGPLYSAVLEAFLIQEASGTTAADSAAGGNDLTVDLAGAAWGSGPNGGAALEVNGGYEYPDTPPNRVYPGYSDPLPTIGAPITGAADAEVTAPFSIVMLCKKYDQSPHSEAVNLSSEIIVKYGVTPDLNDLILRNTIDAALDTGFPTSIQFAQFASGGQMVVLWNVDLVDDEWHLLILTTDGSLTLDETKLYVDGALQTADEDFSNDGAGSPEVNTSDTLKPFGANDPTGFVTPAWGLIDTLQIFNTALTSGNVASLQADPYLIWREPVVGTLHNTFE